jgi:hypothetical protein
LNIKGELTHVGLSVKSRKAKVEDIFNTPSDAFMEDDANTSTIQNNRIKNELLEENFLMAQKMRDGTKAS